MTHIFGDSLAYSHQLASASWWEEVYKQAFPDMIGMHDLRHDGWHQKAGRDRAVVLSSGKTIYIDEKGRRKTWSDVALEIWSCYPKAGTEPYGPVAGAVPGWAAQPKDTDFLAYAFEPSRTCYLFPFLGIRAAYEKHRPQWITWATERQHGLRWVVAENERYQTISIAVPIVRLQAAIKDSLVIKWKVAA